MMYSLVTDFNMQKNATTENFWVRDGKRSYKFRSFVAV